MTLLVILITALSVFAPSIVYSEIMPEHQLKKLEQELELQLKLHKIPGLSIAIVKDGKTIYSKGLGYKNIAEQDVVTKDTIFPIGSVSKQMTSVLVGMRVDEGAVHWDDLIADYLPYYTFSQNNETVLLTLRDALSHRTGYGRNDTLWAKPDTPRIDILKGALDASPLAEHGTEYHYNNVMYLAAGMATAHDKQFNWDALLVQRLLKPLKMFNTTSDYLTAIKDPRLSKGYYWDDLDLQHNELQMQNLNNIAPAGGIYSNAEDMAKWLKFILNQGEVENKQLIEPKTLKEMFMPMVNVSPTFDYGLGWNITDYNGELLLEHAGSIEGYSAQIALLPESGIGFILLMNVSVTPLQLASINLVFDTLTKDYEPEKRTPEVDYASLVGDYLANFWQFKNVYFSFKVHGGKPALNIPGQTLYMLKPPNEEGKFYFEITNNAAVSFNVNDRNEVISMVHHEAGQQFILPKKVHDVGAEGDSKFLNKIVPKVLTDIMDVSQQKEVYENLGRLTIEGSVLQEQTGIKGSFKLIADKLNWHLEQDLGGYAFLQTKRGTNGGVINRLRHGYQLKGHLFEQATREHPFHFLYWKEIYQGISVEKNEVEQGSLIVSLEGSKLSNATATIDKLSGHVQKISMPFIDPVWGQHRREISFFDYKSYCGLDYPGTFVIDDHDTGRSTFTIRIIKSENCAN